MTLKQSERSSWVRSNWLNRPKTSASEPSVRWPGATPCANSAGSPKPSTPTHALPICIHAGSAYRHPVTSVGWPSYYTEDYAAQAVAFQTQLTSLICEGVFSKFPNLRVVLAESGITWLPAYLWRLTKYWRGLRTEIPWTDVAPIEIVRRNVRFTLQPVDAPPGNAFARILDHIGCDELLLFSTDYPHWQFDGDAALPEALPGDLVRKIMIENPRQTYPRLLKEAVR